MNSIIFLFPQHFIAVLLCEWVGLSDMPHLDSACCGAANREVLLEVVRSPQSVFAATDASMFEDVRCIQWFLLRCLKVSSLYISCSKKPFDVVRYCLYLWQCGSHLKHLTITMYNNQTTKLSTLLNEAVILTPDLKSLRLETMHAQPQDSVLSLICRFKKLKMLDIVGGQAVIISRVEHLQQDLDIPSLLPSSIAQTNTSITHLKLHFVLNLDFNVVCTLCPNLQSLSLKVTVFDASDIVALSANCKHLRALHLIHCGCDADDAAWRVLFQNWKLHTLSMNSTKVNDAVLSYVGMYLHTTLTILDMYCIRGQSDISVCWDVLQQCSVLHTLAIDTRSFRALFLHSKSKKKETLQRITTLSLKSPNGRVDCNVIRYIHEFCSNLHTIYVYNGEDAVMTELVETVKHCPQLRKLYVQKVNDSVVRTMRNINPHLLIELLNSTDPL